MPDRETVIKGLECHPNWNCEECPYYAIDDCTFEVCRNALELLKEQEPVIPILRPSIKGLAWHCGECDWKIAEVPDTVTYEKVKGSISYCASCGRAVKWDD